MSKRSAAPAVSASAAAAASVQLMQLPSTSGAPSQPLHKRDIPMIVKGLKTHAKNATVCREYVVALHARLFEDGPSECRDACAKFIHNSTGGISTLLSTLEFNAGDAPFAEVALVFFYNLIHFGGKRNGRIVVKIVKRGGGRICVSIINKNPANLKVVQPAGMVIVAIGGADSKMAALARLSGCLTNLLALCKQHATLPKTTLATVLCALSTLSRGDLNLLHMYKRGAVPIVLDVCSKNMQRDGSSVLRWACDFLNRLCHHEESAREVVKEGGIALTFNTCFEQTSTVDVQAVCIDTLRLLTAFPEGLAQFLASGGVPYLLTLILENNNDKSEAEWLALSFQLHRFCGIADLPIGADNDLYWTPPEYAELVDEAAAAAAAAAAGGLDAAAAGVPGATPPGAFGAGVLGDASELPENPNARVRLENLSPELFDGDVPDETLLDATVVHHVKPFTDSRPSHSHHHASAAADAVPPVEELLQQAPEQRVEIVKRQIRRLTHASLLINKVVFDDMARDTTLPQSRLSSLLPSAPASPQTPTVATATTTTSSSTTIPTLKFGSNFESGNLKRAIQVFDDEYDLILQPDVNTTSYIQWFFFSIENARSDVTYRFNIINMEKPTSTFNEGQRPLVFSEKRFAWSGFGWLRTGHDIAYYRNPYRRTQQPGTKRRKDGGSGFYSLTFSVRFPHDEDRVFVSNCYPYSYSELVVYLRKLQERRALDDCLMVQSLCVTQAGNQTPLVTITSLRRNGEDCTADEIAQRGVCVVSARVHPGESNSSFVVKGLMDYLLDTASEHAQFLRDNFVWKIVPMLNPDGVVNGNHRCSLSAKDLNREFYKPDRVLNPTIFYLKELVRQIKCVEGRNVMLYGDFHGHSRCRNAIIFACSARKPTLGIIPERVFPRVLGDLVPFFSYDASTYRVQRSKRTTGRVVFYREFGVRMSFTLEASMMGGDGCDFAPIGFTEAEEDICRRAAVARNTQAHFNTAHFQTLGAMFAKALLLIAQADKGLSTRVNDVISELLAQGSQGAERRKRAAKAAAAAAAAAPVAAAAAPVAGSDSTDEAGNVSPATPAAMTGAYATSRRNMRKKKGAAAAGGAAPPATAAELAEIYKVLLRGSGVTRVALTDGDDLIDVDEDDLADVEEEEDNDSDGGNNNAGDDEDFDDEGLDDDEGIESGADDDLDL